MRLPFASRTIATGMLVVCGLLVTSPASAAANPATVAPAAVMAAVGSGGGAVELWLALMLTLLGVFRWLESGEPEEARRRGGSADDTADRRRI